jgi:hypothetical protein
MAGGWKTARGEDYGYEDAWCSLEGVYAPAGRGLFSFGAKATKANRLDESRLHALLWAISQEFRVAVIEVVGGDFAPPLRALQAQGLIAIEDCPSDRGRSLRVVQVTRPVQPTTGAAAPATASVSPPARARRKTWWRPGSVR